MSHVNPLELATYMQGTTDLGDLSPAWIAQAQAMLDDIAADVEAAIGYPIEAASVVVLLAGTWGRDLELPAGNITAVTAVTINGATLDAAGWTWNERTLVRRGAAFADDPGTPPGGQSVPGLSWGGPSATVAVALETGFAEIPAVVRSLSRRIGARTIGNPEQLTQEALGPYSATHGARGDGSYLTDRERKQIRRAMGARRAGTVTTA